MEGPMRALLLLTFLCLGAQEPDPTSMQLRAKAGTDIKLLNPVAKALEQRIAYYGYEGVKVAHDQHGTLQITCNTGLTPEMRKRITTMGLWFGRMAFHNTRQLTEAEREQHAECRTSPSGTIWIACANEQAEATGAWVLAVTPAIAKRSDIKQIKPGVWQFDAKVSKAIQQAHEQGLTNLNFILDGIHPDSSWWGEKQGYEYGNTENGQLTWLPNSRFVEALVLHPIDIILRAV